MVNIEEWLISELNKSLVEKEDYNEIRKALGWYLVYGFSIGFYIEELLKIIKNNDKLYEISKSFSINEILDGKKIPAFQNGYQVEVILNERNKTYHKGCIVGRGWHYKENQWTYFISENGKILKKRYFDCDLNLLSKNINEKI